MNLLPEAIERLSHVAHEELDSVFFKSAIRDIKEFYPLFTPKAFEESLANAKKLQFTNAAGTDVTYELAHKSILTEYGYTATPGRWDHWPGGFLATLASDGGVNGRVVMDVKDIVYPLKSFLKS